MMKHSDRISGFELSLSAHEDGTLDTLYIRFRKGKVKRTSEVIEDTVIADYDENDNLLGIEILAPVKLSELAKFVEQPRRTSFRRFVKHSGPPCLVHHELRRFAAEGPIQKGESSQAPGTHSEGLADSIRSLGGSKPDQRTGRKRSRK